MGNTFALPLTPLSFPTDTNTLLHPSLSVLPRTASEHAASRDRNRTDSTDSRAGGDRSDGDPRGASIGRQSRRRGGRAGGGGGESSGSTAAGFGLGGVVRTGGELDGECWKGGVVVMPSFVMLDLGLTQRQGSYASGTVFQAALVNGVSGAGGGEGGCGCRYSRVALAALLLYWWCFFLFFAHIACDRVGL